jgi:hypothetical protein
MLRRADRLMVTDVPKDGFASVFGVKHSNKRKVKTGLIDPQIEELGCLETYSFIH